MLALWIYFLLTASLVRVRAYIQLTHHGAAVHVDLMWSTVNDKYNYL